VANTSVDHLIKIQEYAESGNCIWLLSTLTTNIRDARAFDDAETKVHENYYIAFSLLMLV